MEKRIEDTEKTTCQAIRKGTYIVRSVYSTLSCSEAENREIESEIVGSRFEVREEHLVMTDDGSRTCCHVPLAILDREDRHFITYADMVDSKALDAFIPYYYEVWQFRNHQDIVLLVQKLD